jgi:hypothetical protein
MPTASLFDPERAAARRRELAEDEVVGVLDQVLDHLLGQGSVDDHGVPVALVEVVSGKHRGVRPAQSLGELGLTLEADPKRVRAELGERSILPPTLNTEVSGPKGNVSSAPVNERQ